MKLNLTHADLTQGNAHTAALLRALAGVIDPAPSKVLATQTVEIKVDTSAVKEALDEIREEAFGEIRQEAHVIDKHVASQAPSFGLDSAGFPWDERIHASSRATVADGTWKLKRGADPELVATLREASKDPILPPPPTEAERLQTEQEQDVPDPAKVGFGQQVPPPPPAIAAPASGDAWPVDVLGAIPDGKTPFQVFMTWAMGKLTDKSLTQPRLLEVIQAHGVAQLPVLNTQPEKIPAIVRDLAGV